MTNAYDTGQRSRRLPGAVLDQEAGRVPLFLYPREVGPTSPSPCGGAYRACVSAAWHNRMSPAWSCRPLYTGTPSLPGRPRGRYSTALAHNAHPSTTRMLYAGVWRWGDAIFGYRGAEVPRAYRTPAPWPGEPPSAPHPYPQARGPGLGPAVCFNRAVWRFRERLQKRFQKSDCKSGDYSMTIR